jgi:putative PIG3 family NAD(P)H quinone oxidoreductase
VKALQGIEGRVEWVDADPLVRGTGQIRIEVAAAGLNRADLLQRDGLYPPPEGASPYIGLECAGVVTEADADSAWRVGDRVCALLAGGGMAEEVVVDERHVLPVPQGLSLPEAAAVPEVYCTAWLNLFQLGGLKKGQKALLHAGASGVGSAGIQLCKAMGNPVWVSVGSHERLAYCEALGAEGGALRKVDLESLRDFAPFDVILNPVGAPYAALDLDLLGQDGRWVLIGLMGGRKAEIDFAKILGKRIQLIGSTLRSRDAGFKAQLIQDMRENVWPLFANGQLKPQLERTFAAQDAEAAFEALASNQVSGKVVIVLDDKAQ